MLHPRIDNAPCGYILLSGQGKVKEVNQTFQNLIEWGHEDIIDKNIEIFLSPASKIIFHSLFLMQIELVGQVEETYVTFKSKSNLEIPFLLSGKLVNSEGENLVDCVAVKISKRNDYEHELQEIKEQLEEAYRLKNEALKQESKLRDLFETTLFSINEGIIVTDKLENITMMNKWAETYTGWAADDTLGHSFNEVFHCVDIRTREPKLNILRKVIETESGQDFLENLILLSKDGTERFIMGTSACLISKDNEINGTVTSFRDITKEYLQEKEIDGFLNVNMDMLCVSDFHGRLHKVNKRFEEILGYAAEDLIGRDFISFVHEEDIQETADALNNLEDHRVVHGFSNRYRCGDGSFRYLEWKVQLGVGQFIYATAQDVTEKRLKEEQLQKIAIKDELTGLYNRHYLNMVLESEMERANLTGASISLAILDLDNFKRVNDTWGHPIGDELLKMTAHITSDTIRKTDLLVRFGGEEFVILMPQTNSAESVIALEKVRAAIENNCHPVTGRQTISIGVAKMIKFETFQAWYKRADEALYRAKQEGRNRVVLFPIE